MKNNLFLRILIGLIVGISIMIPGKFALINASMFLSPDLFSFYQFVVLIFSLFLFNIFFSFITKSIFFQLGIQENFDDVKEALTSDVAMIKEGVSIGIKIITSLAALSIGIVLFAKVYSSFHLANEFFLLGVLFIGAASLTALIFNLLNDFIYSLKD